MIGKKGESLEDKAQKTDISGDLKGMAPHNQLNALSRSLIKGGIKGKKFPDGKVDFCHEDTLFLRLRLILSQAYVFFVCDPDTLYDPGQFSRRSSEDGFEREIMIDDCPRLDILNYFINVALTEAKKRAQKDLIANFDPVKDYAQLFRQVWLDGKLDKEEKMSLDSFAKAAFFMEPERANQEYGKLLFQMVHGLIEKEYPILQWDDDGGGRIYYLKNSGIPVLGADWSHNASITFSAFDDTRHLFMAATNLCVPDPARPGWVKMSLMKLEDLSLLRKLVFISVFRGANGKRPLPNILILANQG